MATSRSMAVRGRPYFSTFPFHAERRHSNAKFKSPRSFCRSPSRSAPLAAGRLPFLVRALHQRGEQGRVLAQSRERLLAQLGVIPVAQIRRAAALLAFRGRGAARFPAVAAMRL